MGTGFYTILNASQASTLTDSLLEYIPIYVQDALGTDQPTFEHLLCMPNPTPDQLRCWLVYVDCTVR